MNTAIHKWAGGVGFPVLLLVLLSSCSYFKGKEAEVGTNPVARVYESFLYEADLKGIGADAATPEDSIKAVKNYIDSWIRNKLVLKYAEENLPAEIEDINKQIENYRQSLIIYTYERELVAQKLDTVISEKEILDYYDKHKEALQLKTPLYNIKYARIKKQPKKVIDSASAWIAKNDFISNSKLQNFCEQYAVKYVINDSTWFKEQELENIFPIQNIDWESIAFNKKATIVTDTTNYITLIKVLGYKFKGADAPLAYIREDISNIIINKRKLDYVSKVHSTIYDDALKNKKFEIYNDE
ncbi:MAG: hypothetical protein ACK5AS_06670 [Bacteroidota bacterium]|jgi:hypothetical protein